ncbi:hypothetical protein H4R33_003999 [Dimargaris cristalligena]|uniref:Needs CLA4 to survive protein 3 n=1 Tax=Dimargaris cristalligena TaxID=215637 RepID=A0A4P9ZWU1_9FUNG|nr:hypothetical protein H4R33_003999 [Dimargaris cristalligena]RKP37441.1 hypothetical protein BJ085DRAFT_22331 [Dimargaris cristalligena]|eukprot:RKP37441.1 hypothetical protein BJ085DRAFT_22331 [Dimargaris cristalligena]
MSAQSDVERLAAENAALQTRIQALTKENSRLKAPQTSPPLPDPSPLTAFTQVESLNNPEIARYSRQLLLPEVGVQGQLSLRNASVLVVGAGGLGSPCILYLAAMGVGKIGVIDHDTVEISNLQRQVIHSESRAGLSKARSARLAVHELNSDCHCIAYDLVFDYTVALSVAAEYDVVVDATDNVPTRYLVNDTCVLLGKPLVSASALKLDGQLTVYNYAGGPCYRCLFPVPPPPETVTNCSDGGVLGVVPGILGTLQALEVVKILTGVKAKEAPTLLLFSAFSSPTFRSIKIRGKQAHCAVCGTQPTITELQDYVAFCGSQPTDGPVHLNLLPAGDRITCADYHTLRQTGQPHLLVDVREPVQYDICRLPGSLHVPWRDFAQRVPDILAAREAVSHQPIYIICRLGNDSQEAVLHLRERGVVDAKDIVGGLLEWHQSVDPTFPAY